MFLVRKYLVLCRQEGTTRIDEVNARQSVLLGNFLRAQVFLDGERIISAAFDGRVVRDDDALGTVYATDARDDAGRWNIIVVDLVAGESAEFQERFRIVNQHPDAIAGQQLATRKVFFAGAR